MDEVNKKLWLGEKEDWWYLLEVIEQWYLFYGQMLVDFKCLLVKFSIICNGLGDFIVLELIVGDFMKYWEVWLKGEVKNEDGVFMLLVKFCMVNFE